MQPQRTASQYRAIDLSLFAVILIVFETLLLRASMHWFPREPWTVSATAAVTAIVMVRWGPWAAIHAVIGGIVSCAVNHGQWQQYLIYCLGNLAALSLIPLIKRWGWETLRKDVLKNLLFGFLTLMLMHAGRAATAMILGTSPAAAAGFFTTDVVSYIFTITIVWIASRLDGILEDQQHYLQRINNPKNREGGIA